MSYLTIEEYNTSLVNNKEDIDIMDYIKVINKLEYNIDISFIDEFIKLVHRKDFCIHHNMLQKYGVLALKDSTKDVKRLLEQNDFKENKDYTVGNVADRSSSRTIYKNEYYLKPKTFKLCLMRSKNVKLYALYYLLLEECISYYKEYKDELNKKYIIKLKDRIIKKDNIIIEKDDKIDKLQEKIDTLIKNSNEILKNNAELLNESRNTKVQLDNIIEELNESNNKLDNITEELEFTNEELDDTNKTVKLVAKKLDIAVIDRVVRTNKSSTLEYFIIMKSNTNIDYMYYIIRGQKRYINKKMNLLEDYYKIKSIECVPNASLLWNLMKQNMKNNIDCSGNKLNLLNINEDIFLEKIDSIYNKRKIIEINL